MGLCPKPPLHRAPDPHATKMGWQTVPKSPEELKAAAGDGRARRRREGRMGRARANKFHPNTLINSISTAQRTISLHLGSALARGPMAAHDAPGLGSPWNLSCWEGCGPRQEEERKKYVEGSQGFKKHINKNPPTQTNQGNSPQFVNHPLQVAQRLPSPKTQGKEPAAHYFST